MNRKRSIEDDASQRPKSPRKRSKYDNSSFQIPETPAVPVASGSWSSSSPTTNKTKVSFATPGTPYTPYPPQPSDSPSNPFGRKRTERLIHSLPPVSSFSKHVPLRFQFVRTGKGAPSPRLGGVHRIARVPMNYTIVHLRCLIAWLFNTPALYANGAQGFSDDYLFEVKEKVAIYSQLYKPFQIKSGVTTVKLSNVRDPARRWRSRYGFGGEEDELSDDEEEAEEEEMRDVGTDMEEDELADWQWADEEEFTLGHAFPRGISADIGIIYHHSPTTQIHITVNKLLLPRQRGVSNTPHVFSARGRVHLSPAPLPQPVFSKSIFHILSSSPAPHRSRSSVPIPVASKPNTKARTNSKGKGKAVVRLKSPYPTRGREMGKSASNSKSNATRVKMKSPPPARDEDLTDTDANGDTDQDQDGGVHGLHPFDATHPFFHAQGSSPFMPIRNDGRKPEREVIYVADSDEEEQKVILDDDSDRAEQEEVEEERIDWKEDHNMTLDTEKWNDPPYAFARYLLEYMDPRGYQGVVQAIARGELDEEELFKEEKVFDPFDCDDDDEVNDEEGNKEGRGSDDAREGRERRKHSNNAEEDEDMEESPTEEQSADDEDEEEEEAQAQLQIEDYTQGSGSTPGLTNTYSSASSLPPSSPPRIFSPTFDLSTPNYPYSSTYNISTTSLPDPTELSSIIVLEEHYPNKKYTFTPAPPKARVKRLRIERLERRLARAKKGVYLTKCDEPEAEKDEEVDELASDDEEEDQEADRGSKWTKPILKEGEVWDPFGDEEEV